MGIIKKYWKKKNRGKKGDSEKVSTYDKSL